MRFRLTLLPLTKLSYLKIVIVSVLLTIFILVPSKSFAQSCGGQISCCTHTQSQCPVGCTEALCPGQCKEVCTQEGSVSCSAVSIAGCGDSPWAACKNGFPENHGCYEIEACPSGQFCGGCIADCRPNTKVCGTYGQANTWIGDECSGDTGGPVVNTPPPPTCSPSISCSPACGQWNGCGYCANTDGQPFLATPKIVEPALNENFVHPSSVYVNWPNDPNANAGFRVKVERVIPGENLLVHDANNIMVSNYTVPASAMTVAGTYRVKVKAKQALCANSNWSPWVKFTLTEPAPTCTVALNRVSLPMTAGTSFSPLVATVTPANGTVQQVAFSSSNTAAITVNPAVDTVSAFQTIVTAGAGGHANITATATVRSPSGVLATCATTIPAASGQITGRLCLADRTAYSSNGATCTTVPSGCTPYIPQEGETVTVTHGSVPTQTIPVNTTNGTFSFNVPPAANYTVRVNSSDPLNSCACPGGCSFASVTAPNAASAPVNFYYRPAAERDPWFQVTGGHVYAGGDTGRALESKVPTDTCETPPAPYTCNPYFITRDKANNPNSSGAVVTAGGSIDVNHSPSITTGNIDQDNREYQVIGTKLDRYTENYEYYFRQYSMEESTNTLPAGPLTKPASNPAIRAYKTTGSVTVRGVDPAWTVASGESIVIFVDGDLAINNFIDVAPGGFLAFIVRGNITVSATVTRSNFQSNEGIVEGVFVTNGVFRVAGNASGGDRKFVGEGIFVAHQGFDLQRDYDDNALQSGYNGIAPTELFIYRPDFMINLPARMKRPLYEWQEVVQ